MLTPLVIQAVWILGSLGLIGAGVVLALGGGSGDPAASTAGGIALAVFGPLALRIYCEVLIVIFKIYERLGLILDAKGAAPRSADERLASSGPPPSI